MKKGISLIVLVITIIVIIILAGAIILSLSANNPIASANKATCLSDVSNFKSAVAMDFAYQVSLSTTGIIVYSKSTLVTDLEAKLLKKYGLSAVITSEGGIVFSSETEVPGVVGKLPMDTTSGVGVTLGDIN